MPRAPALAFWRLSNSEVVVLTYPSDRVGGLSLPHPDACPETPDC